MSQVPQFETGTTVVYIFGTQPWKCGASRRVWAKQLLYEQGQRLFDELAVAARDFRM
jgi:hypothetical protein